MQWRSSIIRPALQWHIGTCIAVSALLILLRIGFYTQAAAMLLGGFFLALLPIVSVLATSKSCQNGPIKIKDRKCERYCGWELKGDYFKTCHQPCYLDCVKACAGDSRCQVASWNRKSQKCFLSKGKSSSSYKKTGKGDGVYCPAPQYPPATTTTSKSTTRSTTASTTTTSKSTTTSTTTTTTTSTAPTPTTCATFLIRSIGGVYPNQFLLLDADPLDGTDLQGSYYFIPSASDATQFRLIAGNVVAGQDFQVPMTVKRSSPILVRPYGPRLQAERDYPPLNCHLPRNAAPGNISCISPDPRDSSSFFTRTRDDDLTNILQFGRLPGFWYETVILEAVCPSTVWD